jgi:hypothetical protein
MGADHPVVTTSLQEFSACLEGDRACWQVLMQLVDIGLHVQTVQCRNSLAYMALPRDDWTGEPPWSTINPRLFIDHPSEKLVCRFAGNE